MGKLAQAKFNKIPGSARQGNKPGVAKRCARCHFSKCECSK